MLAGEGQDGLVGTFALPRVGLNRLELLDGLLHAVSVKGQVRHLAARWLSLAEQLQNLVFGVAVKAK